MSGGFAVVQWVAGLGLVVVPAAVAVLSLAPWYERAGMASLAAQEAARAAVLADDWEAAVDASTRAVAAIEARSCIEDPGCLRVELASSSPGRLDRGGSVSATVTVRMPMAVVPFVGTVADFEHRVTHRETIDRYRSFP